MSGPSGINTNTLRAFALIPGRTEHFHVAGTADWSGGGKFGLFLYGGDGTVGSGDLLGATPDITVPTSDPKLSWQGLILLTCFSVGSSGSCMVSGIIHFVNDSCVEVGAWPFYATSPATIDTTVSNTFMMYANYSSGGNDFNTNTANIINVA